MARGKRRKEDDVPSKQVTEPKHRRSSGYIPTEISFDASEHGSVEDEAIELNIPKSTKGHTKQTKHTKRDNPSSKAKTPKSKEPKDTIVDASDVNTKRTKRSKSDKSDPKSKSSSKSSKSSIPSNTTLSETVQSKTASTEGTVTKPTQFKVYRSLRKLEIKNPSKNAIIKLVDSRFGNMDLRTNTVSDVYKIVEDHFVTTLSKENRRVIRRRLVELSSEKALEQQEKLENTPRAESPLLVDDVSDQEEEINLSQEDESDDVIQNQDEEIVFSPDDESGDLIDVMDFGTDLSEEDSIPDQGSYSRSRRLDDIAETGENEEQYGEDQKLHNINGNIDPSDEEEWFSPDEKRNKTSHRRRRHRPDPVEDHKSLQHDTGKGKKSSRYHRRQSLGMEQSLLCFKNISLAVGRGDKTEHILKSVSGNVKAGNVLTVMGPAGAGKTSLINVLAREACFGKSSGRVLLNGETLTGRMIKQHAYVMKEQDKHWSYLTCRETLLYATQLYAAARTGKVEGLVDEIIRKTGLGSCADTACSRLNAVQCRCLSIGIALIKQPTLLFLDDPTLGCDSHAAAKLLYEIRLTAREQRLIVVQTISQPSLRVFDCIDKIMILSKGRVAFVGDANLAETHFAEMGYICPIAMNPAEYFLDVVNPNFSGEELVDEILETWEVKMAFDGVYENPNGEEDGKVGIVIEGGCAREIRILLRRQGFSMLWDPTLYLGRCVAFLVFNLVCACVYWKAREVTQDQALNLLWLVIWLHVIPCSMGVVAVNALNNEFKSILREVKNGMFHVSAYVLAKSILVIPVIFLFSVLSIGIQGYVVQQFDPESFVTLLLLFSAGLYAWESIAECYSVWFLNPTTGMIHFMATFLAALSFGGIFLPLRDLYWPFTLFYYILPFPYYVRSAMYAILIDEEFDPCTEATNTLVCVNSTSGADVLDELTILTPLVSSEDTVVMDILIILAIAVSFKIVYIIGVTVKTFEP